MLDGSPDDDAPAGSTGGATAPSWAPTHFVLTRRPDASFAASVHYVSAPEAARVARAARRAGLEVVDGPRALSERETATGQEREAARAGAAAHKRRDIALAKPLRDWERDAEPPTDTAPARNPRRRVAE
jgi:hypothetical protein